MGQDTPVTAPPFAIFRAAEARDCDESLMYYAPVEDAEMAGIAALGDAGMLDGTRLKVLYRRPGMSLAYAWFKSGFPLPLHSHNADCLYFIVAGSLDIGTETLGPGDGFFVGTDVPYSYVPGPDGVEVLEFRSSDHFDYRSRGKSGTYWDRMLEKLLAARGGWPGEIAPPSGMTVGSD